MTALETVPHKTISYENTPPPPEHTLTWDEIELLSTRELAQVPFHLAPEYNEIFNARLTTFSNGILTRDTFVETSSLNRWPKGLLSSVVSRNQATINLRRPYFYNAGTEESEACEAYSQANHVVDTLAQTDIAGKVLCLNEFAEQAASLGAAMDEKSTLTRKMFQHHLGVQPGSTVDRYRVVPLADRQPCPSLPYSVGEVFHGLANRCDNTRSQAASEMGSLFSIMVHCARIHTLSRFALIRLLAGDMRTRGIAWSAIIPNK